MKKQRGITLIALIITIIILLILAGVSINLVLGNNGILSNAQLAVKSTKNAELEEIIGLYEMERALGEKDTLKTYLIKNNIITEDEIENDGIVKLNSDTILGISTQSGLEKLSEEVAKGNDYSGVTIYLLNDIEFDNDIDFATGTLVRGTQFTPIGDSNSKIEEEELEGSIKTEFNGTFDGRNYEIKKVYIKEVKVGTEEIYCAGFFGYVGEKGIVKNLTISESYVTGNFETGAVVGRNRGTISNCINKCDITAIKLTGGIAGRNTGTIENCINYGNINGSATQTAGIVANCDYGENIIVRNCKNYGQITSTSNTVGGIVGGVYNANMTFFSTGTISNCENYGEIGGEESSYIDVGGIVGFSKVSVLDCVNNGKVDGYKYVGGIAGRTTYTETLGGISSNIENCKNKGIVSGRFERVGGICGWKSGGIISKCSNHEKVELIGEEAYFGVGGIAGSIAATAIDTKIEYCYNTGHIVLELALDKSTQCAGIVANVNMAEDGSTICEIVSCYNIGTIECTGSASTGLPAGIGGWGKSFRVKNCYNIGTLIRSQTYPRGIWATYQTSAEHTFENNYWLDTCGATYGVGTVNSNEGVAPKTDAEMKSLAAILGSDYAQDRNINNGYPYLKVNKP